MRILFLSWRDTCHPFAGGSEVLIDRLASGLHERGHEVTVLCGGPTGEHAYRAVDAGTRLQQYLKDPFTVRRRFPDVDVIVDVCNGVAFYSPLWSHAPVVAHVNHIHFGMWEEWFSKPVAWVGNTLETKIMPWMYRHTTTVAISESTADALTDLGIPAANIRIVHSGVDLPESFAPKAPEPTFVALGRLVPHKRVDLLLRAWAEVQPITGGRLLVAGDGPDRALLEESAPPGTEFLGYVSENDKADLLARSWLLVQPTRLEGWGLGIMEAAAVGTPTLGFTAPGTRDAVVHQESGILVDTEAQLVRSWIDLAQDHEERKVLAKGALRRAELFSWDRTVDRYEAVLEEVTAQPPRGARARRRRQQTGRGASQGARAAVARPPSAPARSRWSRARTTAQLFRLWLAEKHDPDPFYRELAARTVDELPFPVSGHRILDLGCGSGHFADALRAVGAEVVPLEPDVEVLRSRSEPVRGAIAGDGTRLCFADASFDIVFCSNVLEHTADPAGILSEIGRVLRPGGRGWVSWTNWYSPWGGHNITPLHYLGPRRGLQVWRRLFGEPPKNVPFDGLWPTHIGQVLRMVDRTPSLALRDSMPRYYPSQRWITRVPGFREVFTWNCVLLLERVADR